MSATFCQALRESCRLAESLPRGRPSQARVWFVSSSILTDGANLLCVDRHPLRHAKEADGRKEIGINKIKKV